VHMVLKIGDGAFVKSDLGIGVISMVDLVRFNRLGQVESDLVNLLGIAEDDALHNVLLKAVIIKSNIDLLFSEPIDANFVVEGLFNCKAFDVGLVIVFDLSLKEVDAAGLKPGIRPKVHSKIFAH